MLQTLRCITLTAPGPPQDPTWLGASLMQAISRFLNAFGPSLPSAHPAITAPTSSVVEAENVVAFSVAMLLGHFDAALVSVTHEVAIFRSAIDMCSAATDTAGFRIDAAVLFQGSTHRD